jgi:hypothetical protein
VVSGCQWGGAMQPGKSFLIRDLLGDVLLPGVPSLHFHSLYRLNIEFTVSSVACFLIIAEQSSAPTDCFLPIYTKIIFTQFGKMYIIIVIIIISSNRSSSSSSSSSSNGSSIVTTTIFIFCHIHSDFS